MRTSLVSILAVSSFLSAGGSARSQPTTETASFAPACPTQATAADDGCARSNPRATTQHIDFFKSYALQSHQHAYKTRPPWNVAGVDYPVGYYTPLARLLDVRKTQPSGCKLQDWPGGKVLYCGGAGVLKISGYRFDVGGGTSLIVDGQRMTSITVNDSYFLNGPATDRRGGALVVIRGGEADFTVTNSTFDVDGRNQVKGMSYAISDAKPGGRKEVFRYNAFFRMTEKGLGMGTCGDTYIQYNYFEEMELGFGHGEFIIDGNSNCIKDTFVVTYNTGLQTAGLTRLSPGGGVAALLFMSAGNDKRSWNNVTVSHNTLVANRIGSANVFPGLGSATTSRMIEEGGGSVYGTMEYSDNYIDPSGSLLCYYVPTPKPAHTVFRGNKNLLDRSRIDDFANESCHGHHP